MKVKMYVRVGKTSTPKGYKVAAGVKPVHAPLTDTLGRPFPTVAFAVEMNIEDAAFTKASDVIAKLDIPAALTEVAAEVVGAA